jgi:hypothetical protein
MNKVSRVIAWLILTLLIATPALAGFVTIPYTFSPNTTIFSSQVNSNFTALANVINGGLDHTNLSSSAGITLSQLNLNPGGQAFNKTTIGATTWCSGLTTDTVPSVAMVAGGGLQFGPGASGSLDVALKRTAANTLQLNNTSSGSGILDMNSGSIINVSSLSTSSSITCASLTAMQGLTTGTNGGTGGNIILNGATSGSATIGVQPVAGATTFNLPVGNGSSGNYLKGDGAGNLSYGNPVPSFSSAGHTFAVTSGYTIGPHGLGVIPSRVWAVATCVTPNIGYTASQTVVFYGSAGATDSATMQFAADATNVYVYTSPQVPVFVTGGGGNSQNITYADWTWTIYAMP